MNPDSIRIAIFGVCSADAISPDSIRIEVLVRTHLKVYNFSTDILIVLYTACKLNVSSQFVLIN